jgi:HSP20 family protein
LDVIMAELINIGINKITIKGEIKMTLIKYAPFKTIDTLEKQMSRIFHDMPFRWDFSTNNFTPKLDVLEDEKNLIVEAEIPGMEKKDVKITLHNNVLTISGERKSEAKTENDNYYHRESSYGTFERSVELPVEVDSERVEASFKNGLLKIQMLKVNPKDISKTIEIQ